MHKQVTTSYYEHAWFCWTDNGYCVDTPVQFLTEPVAFYDDFNVKTDNIAWENWYFDHIDDTDTSVSRDRMQWDSGYSLDLIERIDCQLPFGPRSTFIRDMVEHEACHYDSLDCDEEDYHGRLE